MEEPEAGELGDQTDTTGQILRHTVRHADLPAVAEVRRLLREHLRDWGVPVLCDTAELLATELVTNALQHTTDGAVLTATLVPERTAGERLRVEVYDDLARHPRLPAQATAPEDHGTSGRGLLLVQSLADAWGAHSRGKGKVVWFELDARRA
ncbi:ATP-binding protein [Streptomyces sp. CBMA29]|uniref:ATP-binding protein n=1 Tax=Streptomyces sp. CBMA29 TaxID=1896314 RepID=UPI001661F9DC|nr:ATP-binding protein [Streptomyces sp. CBMA29]